jgi:uncharacterized protein YndB with AHSA1/START domain
MKTKTETRSIAMEFDLPHPPAKVWRALTDPELVASWLMANDMRATVGQSFTFKAQPTPWWDGIVRCKVLESDPHKRLRYTWESSGVDTVVTWTLTPTPSGGTKLSLEQSGFQPDAAQAFEGARQGWQKMLAKLQEVLGNL